MDGIGNGEAVDENREELDQEYREMLPQLREILRDWETLKGRQGCPAMLHVLRKRD